MELEGEVEASVVTSPGDATITDKTMDPEQQSIQGESSTGKKRKVFPYHITSELKSLYRSGMIGVGVQYSSLIDAACQRTGLSKAQVKSWIKRTKYHQRKTLKQDEERDKINSYSLHTDDEQVTYLDPTGEEEHNAAPLYGQDNIRNVVSYSSDHHHQQGIVILDNSVSHNSIPPSLKRHIVMPREIREQESGSDIVSLHPIEKRTTTRLPIVHTSDLTRTEEISREPSSSYRSHTGGAPNNNEVTYATLSTHSPTHHSISTHQTTPTTLLQRHPPALLMTNGSPHHHMTTDQQINQEASRIFRKIERNFKKLEELGYQGFAFGIHGDDTQLVHSSSISHCFTSPLLSYLRAVIVAANPPPLIPHAHGINTTSILNSSSSTGHVHLSLANIAPNTSSSSRQQLYMYEQNPTRIHQRTAIYELSENDSYDEGSHGNPATDIDQVQIFGGGSNGKTVHVVVACDPNLYDGDISD